MTDGLRCAGFRIASRAFLLSLGAACPTPYHVTFVREDGTELGVYVPTLARLRELVLDLRPATVQVHVSGLEDGDRLLCFVHGEITEAEIARASVH